jgi:AcrR family transcriptional regulator
MANLADVIQQLGPNIVYNEKTSRFHDMAQNYRMVSAKNVTTAGAPTRGREGQSGYVSQETFDAFRSDVYRYISQVATFSREALIEVQKSMTGERRDTQNLVDQERAEQEARREKRRERVEKIASTLNSASRRATGMDLLGAFGSAAGLAALAVLGNMTPQQIENLQGTITGVIDGVRNFFNTLEQYGTIIATVGAGLLSLAAAGLALRNRPTAPPRPAPNTRPPSTPGGQGPSNRPSTAPSGGGGGTRPAPAPSSVPQTGNTPQTPGQPTRPQTPPTTQTPPQAQPAGTPERARNALPRRMIRAGALSAIFNVIPSGIDAYRLIRERNEGQLSEEEFKEQMINLVGGALGGMAGAAAGGAIGTLLGPVGTIVGGIAGGILGEAYGPEIARALFRAYLDETESPDDYFQQMAQGAQIGANMATELSRRLASLRQESRERVISTEENVNQTERAVAEGRITERQAQELRNRIVEPLSSDKIEELVQQLQSGGDTVGLTGRGRNLGVTILPPIVQPIQRQTPSGREPPSSDPIPPGDIQTTNPDPMFHEAAAAAAFNSTRQGRGGMLDRARHRNAYR